jgi:hypothetical protein
MKNILLALIIPVLAAKAQNITNFSATILEKKVVLTYDLEAPVSTFMYKVEVYSSIDQYSQPLKSVSGEVGEKISVGNGKKIEWQPQLDVKEFGGDVDFKLKTTLVYAPWLVTKPNEQTSYKRGKIASITWTGYSPTAQNVRLELQKDGQAISNTEAVTNSGQSDFSFPQNLKVGGGYQLKVSNTTNANELAISKEFKIKRKIPLVVKLLPIAIVGGVAAAVLGGSKKSSESAPATDVPPPNESPTDILPTPDLPPTRL